MLLPHRLAKPSSILLLVAQGGPGSSPKWVSPRIRGPNVDPYKVILINYEDSQKALPKSDRKVLEYPQMAPRIMSGFSGSRAARPKGENVGAMLSGLLLRNLIPIALIQKPYCLVYILTMVTEFKFPNSNPACAGCLCLKVLPEDSRGQQPQCLPSACHLTQ